uniref:Aromatic-L-amino-acid decarboxylase n=1 Tax=Caenorhabditis japonica TaxID=281687 RepID=A0A8R1HFU3_CAEJA
MSEVDVEVVDEPNNVEQISPSDKTYLWGRLKNAAAFSLFRDLHLNEPIHKKHLRSDYKVYDLNNRVIFYVINNTAMSITKDAPFCLKVMNKDKKYVAKFLRNEPKKLHKQTGLAALFGCCSDTEDKMEVFDDIGNLLSTAILHHDQYRGIGISMRDQNGKLLLKVRGTRDQTEAFSVSGMDDRFLGEIRQKIISSGNSTDNYKGVACWFSPDVPLEIKVLFMAASFLIEIDYFSESKGRQDVFKNPENDYLNPIIKTPPLHERVPKFKKVVVKTKKKKNGTSVASKESRTQSVSESKRETMMMPQIHHTRHSDAIGADDPFAKKDKNEDFKPIETVKEDIEVNGMTREQFRSAAKKVIDYLLKQDESLKTARCSPAVKPGYLKLLLPAKAPMKADDIDDILDDYHKLIVPGLSHSSHPNFHSFYPAGNSFHCLLADLLGAHIGDAGFYWTSNPALTELEVLMMDWLGDMMALPKEFLLSPEGSRGGGCMQRSCSDANFLVLVAARTDKITRVKKQNPMHRSSDILARLVAYTSSDAHSSIKKAAEAAMVRMRVLPTDKSFTLRGGTLHSAMVADIEQGLIPFFVAATFGTSGPCSFDQLHELGPVCREHRTWLHVDASYAGTALICPETRGLMRGIDWADSFCTTPSKLVMAVCDVNCLWVRDRYKLQRASIETSADLPFKGLPTSQRVGALKIWFMLRSIGVENLQNQIREHINLGQIMSKKLQKDTRFEVCNKVVMGLICFRAKANNMFNKALLFRCNETGKISLASCTLQDRFTIRLCINSPRCTEEDLDVTYKLICTEYEILRPFQERIELMSQAELDDFIRVPSKAHSSAEVSRRFPVSNPLHTTVSTVALLHQGNEHHEMSQKCEKLPTKTASTPPNTSSRPPSAETWSEKSEK